MKTSRRRLLLAVTWTGAAACAGVADTAWAQSCGGCAAPAAPGGGAQRTWLEEGGWSARLSSEYEVKDRTYRGHRRVVNDFDETLRVRRVNLGLAYGLTDDWTAALELSDPEFRYRLKPPGGRRVDLTVDGPGDSVLRVGRRFRLVGEEPAGAGGALSPGFPAPPPEPRGGAVPTFTVWAGVSVPTGDVKKPDPAIVRRDFSVSNLQTGTGTFDPVLQARVDLPHGRWTFFSEASAIAPLYENRHDYRTATTLAFSVGAERALGAGLHARLSATFQRVGTDEFRGDDVGVGGGKWIYVTPGLAWDVSESVTVDAGVRLTAMRDADTKIVDSRAAFQLGVTVRF